MFSCRWIRLSPHEPFCLPKWNKVGIQIGRVVFDNKFYWGHCGAAKIQQALARLTTKRPKLTQRVIESAFKAETFVSHAWRCSLSSSKKRKLSRLMCSASSQLLLSVCCPNQCLTDKTEFASLKKLFSTNGCFDSKWYDVVLEEKLKIRLYKRKLMR